MITLLKQHYRKISAYIFLMGSILYILPKNTSWLGYLIANIVILLLSLFLLSRHVTESNIVKRNFTKICTVMILTTFVLSFFTKNTTWFNNFYFGLTTILAILFLFTRNLTESDE
ncbi:hypothetical protein A374_16333 [Fictibacillus macauensis ZFHKF-1]|uniref:Uncharacterized protein n=1 Tax=Fictibacillus macauensis ZFHKF-1 TaxID=1196324 RepID=I8IY04_9BACL|nr:hypothetical protein A374_16333 [Fictibacillus macauensis ZFHKF-1]